VKKQAQVWYQDMGRISYQAAWTLQEELLKHSVNQKVANRALAEPEQTTPGNYLLFCEHNPVYTLGKSGKPEHLLLSAEQLEQQGIEFYLNNRGGDITYHGPGQITGYPVFDLEQFTTDINLYLRNLEEAVILTLAEYGIEAGRYPGLTGVWLDPEDESKARKICAIGIRCSRWVTMHGFAFNINTDLDYFKQIIPCGIEDKGVSSLQAETGREMSLSEVKEKLKNNFARVFGYSYQSMPSLEVSTLLSPSL
jgi:lipoyl(octanoyl) transferase